MKAKFTAIVILLFAATTVIFAQKPITVGILKFGSHFIMLGKDTSSLLTADLSADPRFSFVDRGQLQQVLDEEALGASGIVSPNSAARIGELTGAKVLVSGRVLLSKSDNVVTILASIIGTENGRVFSETEEGPRTNLEAMTLELSKKIAQTIADQSTNLLAGATIEREERIAQIIGKIKGKKRPTVLIKIDEQLPGGAGTFQTTGTELGVLLQKAGFTVVDENSDAKPDIFLTGEAIAATTAKNGSFFRRTRRWKSKRKNGRREKFFPLIVRKTWPPTLANKWRREKRWKMPPTNWQKDFCLCWRNEVQIYKLTEIKIARI